MNKLLFSIAIALMPISLFSCTKEYDEVSVKINHETETDYYITSTEIIAISLNGTSITVDSSSVVIDGCVATINQAGTYSISGDLDDGQIVVDCDGDAVVKIILAGVDIYCSNSAPIFIKKAGKTIIKLAAETENVLEDGSSYSLDSNEEPSATLFSNANLTLYGTGSLKITGHYNDAISTDDGLLIKNGYYDISAADDGIRGKDYVVIDSGTFVVNAVSNGIKSDKEESESQGYVTVNYAVMDVVANGDAITAETDLYIADGIFDLTSGGGSGVSYSSTSTKGLKAGNDLTVKKGSFVISSSDDAIHSNGDITIDGGSFRISTGDDGVHADNALVINEGTINITKSYEGLEAASLTINDGDIHIVASDDGLNTAGGNDGSGTGGGQMGPGAGFSSGGNYNCYINGGYIFVNATGDGIDINGSITMSDGTLIVSGPTSTGNGAIDYDGTFAVNGGTLIAAGSGGMEQGISSSSSQYGVYAFFNSNLAANTLVCLLDSDGNEVVTYSNPKRYRFLMLVSPNIRNGATYRLYYNGSSTGTATDGVYTDGEYTPGTQFGSCTVTSVLTRIN